MQAGSRFLHGADRGFDESAAGRGADSAEDRVEPGDQVVHLEFKAAQTDGADGEETVSGGLQSFETVEGQEFAAGDTGAEEPGVIGEGQWIVDDVVDGDEDVL